MDAVAHLPEIDRRVHRALIEAVLATGELPPLDELSARAGVATADLPGRLAILAAADYLALDAAGRVACLYPFSPSPTPHVVRLDGQQRHAMCAIDALGIAAMLGRTIEIEGSCGDCGTLVRLAVNPGAVTRAEPAETVVLARRGGDEPACETCCPVTLFACGPAHGTALAARLPETAVIPLDEALGRGESIFADFLAESLPARRRRAELVTLSVRT
jgi:hypothetical protein